jgi:hypothetical protein
MNSTKRRPARRWLTAAAPLLAACVAVTTLAACGSSPARARTAAHRINPRHQLLIPASRAGTTSSFLTVTTSQLVTRVPRHGAPGVEYIVRYPVSTVQLRSLRNGRVIAVLLHSLGDVQAVPAPGGSVIAVTSFGCRSEVYRIDPRTGRSTLLRTLPESATDIALSPDGRRLAYITYPASDRQACQPDRQPRRPVRTVVNPGGPIQFLPSVLAVASLATGATVHAATPSPGNPFSDPAWSPDGRQIAAVYSGGDNPVLVMPAARPRFATARWIRPPRRCGYVAATWTVAGPAAVLGCGKQDPGLSPRTLVQLSAAGHPSARWRLPACIDGVQVLTDPAQRQVLVEASTGYGNGPRGCGSGRWLDRIERVRGTALAAVASYPQASDGQLQLTGW